MKKCKYCKSDIDEKAKVCPVCKRSQNNNYILRVLLALVILIGTGFFLVNYFSNMFDKNEKVDESKIYSIGEKIEFDNFNITAVKYDVKERESDIWSAGTGNEFYIITLSFENTSNKEVSFYSSDFKLIDNNGVNYKSETIIKTDEMRSITLESGGTSTKDIRFAMPKGSETATLKYSNGLFGKTIKIKIK